MKLETFFEKFDQFADAPDAVAKMRELVLHLAFSGQLVKSNAERKVGTLASILAESSINGVSKGPTFDRTATEILKISAGTSRRDFLVNEDDFKHVDLPPNEVAKFRLEAGDLLACRFNGNLHYVGRFSYYRGVSGRTQVNPDKLIRFRIDRSKHCPRYVCYAMNSANARSAIESMCATTAGNIGLSAGKLKTVKIPLPPLAEQKRIVAKVDALMALCDRLALQQQERETRHAALARASLARFADAPTPANLPFLFHSSYAIPPADLRKSILTLAVQGKLVPQDPNDEPAEVTFRKLAAAAIEADDDAFPAQWLRIPLAKAGEWRGGGTPSKSRPEFWKGDLPWVSPKDMKVLHIADAQDHISPAAVEGSSVRLIPPGSLLMVVRGMILARSFPVALTMREVTINQDMKALLPSEPKTKEYLLVALRAFEPDVLAAIEHSSHGTCKLKTEFLQDFVMPVPPLAEQRRIVAKVEQLMALVDELETQLAASRATAANLLSALVAELTGTPGGPNVAASATSGTGRRGRPPKSR